MTEESKIECSLERFLPLMCHDIPEDIHLKAMENLNETAKNVEEGLKALRKCIKSENMNIKSDDNFLLLYLRQSKFDVKRAEAKLRNSVQLYESYEEYIELKGIHRIIAAVDNNCVGILPRRDGEGRTVLYSRVCNLKKELFDVDDIAYALGYLSLYSAKCHLTSLCGITCISDAKLDYLHDFLPVFNAYRKYLHYLKLFPLRLQRFDAVNTNSLCRCFYMAITPILPRQIKNRVFLHDDDFECSLLEAYPPSMLPQEFGGTMGPLTCEGYREEFFEFMEKFISEFRPNKN